jgi:hypothetical protein
MLRSFGSSILISYTRIARSSKLTVDTDVVDLHRHWEQRGQTSIAL